MTASDGSTAADWVQTGSVSVRVPGKVNLYLAVGDTRNDGYHELTTVFHAVSLFDEVTVRNADVLSLGELQYSKATSEPVRVILAVPNEAPTCWAMRVFMVAWGIPASGTSW